MNKSQQMLINLERAVKSLELSVATPPIEDRDFGGIIKAFETVYEMMWKTLKVILENNGVPAPFPRVALEESFKRSMISGNEIWKEIMEARNESVHTYDRNMSVDLCRRISVIYFPVFQKSLELLKPFVK
jgi:nucleotidyltransferase substrate binding protein (TIGR01987 family)